MKLRTALLSILIISASFIANTQSVAKPILEDEDRNKELDHVLDNLLKDLKDTEIRLRKAMEDKKDRESARQQCRKLNIFEELIAFTKKNQQLDRSEKYGAAAEYMLEKEYTQMRKESVTKEMLCDFSSK